MSVVVIFEVAHKKKDEDVFISCWGPFDSEIKAREWIKEQLEDGQTTIKAEIRQMYQP